MRKVVPTRHQFDILEELARFGVVPFYASWKAYSVGGIQATFKTIEAMVRAGWVSWVAIADGKRTFQLTVEGAKAVRKGEFVR